MASDLLSPGRLAKHEATVKRPLRCIVKLGGAAVTHKHEIESIDEESLRVVSSQLREAIVVAQGSSGRVLGMDWSRRDGDPAPDAIAFTEEEIGECQDSACNPFIVVHGAGSFGHFQASKSGVHKGGLHLPFVKAGFVATRISVTSLNLHIVRALAREGIPTVGMSPFACGWSTCARNMSSAADLSPVTEAINAGLIPVLHGDAVLDEMLGCTILSGDVIIRHLAQLLMPEYVVFLTDVSGVYDRPPGDPNAVLLREIDVKTDGTWSVVNPTAQDMKRVEITVASHDTTGGMETKILEAAAIAKLGIDVYITKVGTEHCLRALKGEIRGGITDDWLGTLIRSSDHGRSI